MQENSENKFKTFLNSRNVKPGDNVYVGMSGGVDSSVVVALLKSSGCDVKGVYINCWGDYEGCTSREDYLSALEVATKFEIPLEIWDFQKEYEEEVLKPFYESYQKGETPNPDILCNYKVKFGVVLQKILKTNPNAYYATGHYANLYNTEDIINTLETSKNCFKRGLMGDMTRKPSKSTISDGQYPSVLLASGKDSTKDQSYFLYEIINHKNLDRVIFPLGGFSKTEVREIAKKIGIKAYSKPDSQGICFIGNVDIKEFLKGYVNASEGLVEAISGDVIGTHSGVQYYTIGQRHGFNINKYIGKPLYVVRKDVLRNVLVVGDKSEASKLEFTVKMEVSIAQLNAEKLSVRIRNLGEKHDIEEISHDGNLEGGVSNITIRVDKPIFGVAPGQSAVFYCDDIIIGGGTIIEYFTSE